MLVVACISSILIVSPIVVIAGMTASLYLGIVLVRL